MTAPQEIPKLPAFVDVCVIGAGPAGLMATTCLTTFGMSVVHVDDRAEPTTAGRADGLQPRTIEVLRNIGGVSLEQTTPGGLASGRPIYNGSGLAKRMVSQGVRVYEVAFWDPTPDAKLARTSRAPSCPEFIDVVDNYTLLLHQGLIEHAFLDEIEARRRRLTKDKQNSSPPGGVFRPYNFNTCRTLVDCSDAPDYPVECTITHGVTGEVSVVRAKYLLGCDGARSLVRKAMAGGGDGDGEWAGKIRMEGAATDIIWGVCDAAVRTNFPDIKSKCMIHSKDDGSIMVIPRENGLCRFYVQLQQSDSDGARSHVERAAATQEICFERAKKIFEPFELEFDYVDWFSVYQIGQRIASHYTLDHRIFLGGDATHTHSPKAGQGMNISMLDMFSLSWKINLVEKGMADPSILLPTYQHERKGVAEELIRFDAEYSRLFSGRSPKATQLTTDVEKASQDGTVDAQKFIETFRKNAFFTSGCGAIYSANVLNALPDSTLVANYPIAGVFNPTGSTLIAGQRLPPGNLTRAEDANRVRIQQQIKMNGAFRIHIFAGDFEKSRSTLATFDVYLSSPASFLHVHRPLPNVKSSIVDDQVSSRHIEADKRVHELNPFFTFLTVFSTPHTQWEIEDVPYNLRIFRNQIYSDDIFDKRLPSAGTNHPMHVKYGVDVQKGSIIVVRPDGYVGAVVTLNEDGFDGLSAYFKGFLTGSTDC